MSNSSFPEPSAELEEPQTYPLYDAQLVDPHAYRRVRDAFERVKDRREASPEDWRELGAAVEQMLSTPVKLVDFGPSEWMTAERIVRPDGP